MECRKYYSQFSTEEKNVINNMIRKNKEYKLCNHALNSQIHRKITNKEIQETIKNGKIIEYHFKDGENRAVVRSNKNYGGYAVCVVLDLDTGCIITVYTNKYSDNHFTLNKNNYNEKINIIKLIKEGYKNSKNEIN